MNKNYTLKELTDIGAKAAFLDTAGAVKLHQNCREAFAKAILDAIGYEFPKDEELEAFERWLESNPKRSSNDDLLEAWKAGREELRKEFCSDKCEDAKPKEPAWIPWEGGECPLPDTVKRWEYRMRNGKTNIITNLDKMSEYWSHVGLPGDIVAYRVWEG